MGRFTCLYCNKNSYQSLIKAQRVADQRSTRHFTLDVYKCPHGNAYHLTKWKQSASYS